MIFDCEVVYGRKKRLRGDLKVVHYDLIAVMKAQSYFRLIQKEGRLKTQFGVLRIKKITEIRCKGFSKLVNEDLT